MDKKEIVNIVIDYYLNSYEYNGMPIGNIDDYDSDVICDLIDDDLLEVYSCKYVLNPYVRNSLVTVTKEQQKEAAISQCGPTTLYPTKKALKNVKCDNNKPFTAMMQKGSDHFELCFFDMEILERYYNNPRFMIFDYGYRGEICARDGQEDDDIIDEYIKNWGIAYKKETNGLHRAICAFTADLAKLTDKKQSLWYSFMLNNQKDYVPSQGFVTNLICGEWVTDVWVFDALLKEMGVINKQCDAIGIPHLFNKSYDDDNYFSRPEGYRNIFLPTLKNYNDFVMVLEKLVVHNLSYKIFEENGVTKPVERNKEDGKQKGSLILLEEWMKLNIITPIDIDQIIIKPLKNIRKLRQKPAHEIMENQQDIVYYEKQRELINQTYGAVRGIRMLFANHPKAKNVKIPEYLVTGEKIVNY